MDIRMTNVNIIEAPQDHLPKCPYCNKDLDEIWSRAKDWDWPAKSASSCAPTAAPCWPTAPGDDKI